MLFFFLTPWVALSLCTASPLRSILGQELIISKNP